MYVLRRFRYRDYCKVPVAQTGGHAPVRGVDRQVFNSHACKRVHLNSRARRRRQLVTGTCDFHVVTTVAAHNDDNSHQRTQQLYCCSTYLLRYSPKFHVTYRTKNLKNTVGNQRHFPFGFPRLFAFRVSGCTFAIVPPTRNREFRRPSKPSRHLLLTG